MKTHLLLFLFCLSLLNQVSAQTKLRIGLSGGATFSTLVRDSNLNAKGGYLGYILGTTARLNMGVLGWFVQTGVHYSHEGDVGQKLDFVKVPLTVGLDFSDDVGLYVSYVFMRQVGNENNVQDFYKESAQQFSFGADIYLTERITLGSRLNYGLSNLVDDPIGAMNYQVKPFGFDLYLIYFFIK